MVLDSWLNSVHSDDNWKWIHCASGELSTTASHQNQRPHRFTFSGGFPCWGVRCSFTVLLSHKRWLQLASTLCVLGGFYKVALCVRLYNELVQLGTWSVYGCCEATNKSRHYVSTYINFFGYPSLPCNFCPFHGFVSNIFSML